LNIQYHPGKANVVADALSRKNYYNNLMVRDEQPELCDELERLKLEIVEQGHLNTLIIKYNLMDRIRQAQKQCPELQKLKVSNAGWKSDGLHGRRSRDLMAKRSHMCTPGSRDPYRDTK
jgi:hypothetical protein